MQVYNFRPFILQSVMEHSNKYNTPPKRISAAVLYREYTGLELYRKDRIMTDLPYPTTELEDQERRQIIDKKQTELKEFYDNLSPSTKR